ncbi:MAG: hypothetical protein KUG77_09895 [Nannocystaceae bacterium]|nr:hypothetical protein [Nannocystaceae bacterium]
MTSFFQSTWAVTLELAPWLLLGAIIAGALHVALPPGFVKRAFVGRRGVLTAVALGVPLPLWSNGGSFALTTLIGVGFVINVSMRRNLF